MKRKKSDHHVVIIGGGFGGMYAAKALGKRNIRVTLIDRRNFHLFQPLLYQVAMGELSAGEIAAPLRSVLKHKNTKILNGEVTDINPGQQTILVDGREMSYDSLLVAAGAEYHYFGNPHWADYATPLKTVEDALTIRQKVFDSFENAEAAETPEMKQKFMTFVIAGGGPTGVELAGALGELAKSTLAKEYKNLSIHDLKIILVEASDRVLQSYPKHLGQRAIRTLKKLGVSIRLSTSIVDVSQDKVDLKGPHHTESISAATVLWAAGVRGVSLGRLLGERTGTPIDSAGRVMVSKTLNVDGFDNVFVIGDLANFSPDNQAPLPGVAPVAMQQGQYVARLIDRRLRGKSTSPFFYLDKGRIAVIGSYDAVAVVPFLKLKGLPAWGIWAVVHLYYLAEFDSQVKVLWQWVWNTVSRTKKGAKLITFSPDQDSRINP